MSQTIVRLNGQPHKSQLKDKMIEGKQNNMNRAKDMGVIRQRKEKKEKNVQKPIHNKNK
jgi:hypothetical protein